MSGSRQKTQRKLTRRANERGEAPSVGTSGAELVMAVAAPESPAATWQLMEDVCQRDNLVRAAARSREQGRSGHGSHDDRRCQELSR